MQWLLEDRALQVVVHESPELTSNIICELVADIVHFNEVVHARRVIYHQLGKYWVHLSFHFNVAHMRMANVKYLIWQIDVLQ